MTSLTNCVSLEIKLLLQTFVIISHLTTGKMLSIAVVGYGSTVCIY